ncbi:MAG TPA: glycosyltransferase [Fibrobacteria bacterium]|nr:glycosyltransferase [Fibrobacteria bacterium]
MTVLSALGLANAASLAVALAICEANRRGAPRVLSGAASARTRRLVSVLVPVRDEMANLPAMLEAWRKVEHPEWELVLLDDGSTDGSLEFLRGQAGEFSRLRVLEGESLPQGWKGKNWACHQLASQAGGELLLFVDADVLPGPRALSGTVDLLETEGAGLVSGFGRQESASPLVGALVSLVVDLPLRSLLPLRLAADRPEPSLVAAVGQWMMFTREAYLALGGHQAVAGVVSEDLALARRAKRQGIKVVAALADTALSVRMYRDPVGAWSGFVKNFADLGGGGPAGWIVSMGFVAWFYLLPPILLVSGCVTISVIPAMLLAILLVRCSGRWSQGLRNLAWFPLVAPFLVGIGLRSALNSLWPVAWKGRIL